MAANTQINTRQCRSQPFAHDPKVAGSIPAPAMNETLGIPTNPWGFFISRVPALESVVPAGCRNRVIRRSIGLIEPMAAWNPSAIRNMAPRVLETPGPCGKIVTDGDPSFGPSPQRRRILE
jgi:hypothetical protein